MKITASIVILSMVFLNVMSFAEVTPAKKGESIIELLNRLHKEYIFMDEALKELEKSIREFPDTTLNLSVLKRDMDVRLVSIEVLDNSRLLKSHIYTPLENEALKAGGRQQLYEGEVKKGSHILKVIYHWTEGDKPPETGEAFIVLSILTGKSYVVELSFEKSENGVVLYHSLSYFDIR